jgi:hypothetical protein
VSLCAPISVSERFAVNTILTPLSHLLLTTSLLKDVFSTSSNLPPSCLRPHTTKHNDTMPPTPINALFPSWTSLTSPLRIPHSCSPQTTLLTRAQVKAHFQLPTRSNNPIACLSLPRPLSLSKSLLSTPPLSPTTSPTTPPTSHTACSSGKTSFRRRATRRLRRISGLSRASRLCRSMGGR